MFYFGHYSNLGLDLSETKGYAFHSTSCRSCSYLPGLFLISSIWSWKDAPPKHTHTPLYHYSLLFSSHDRFILFLICPWFFVKQIIFSPLYREDKWRCLSGHAYFLIWPPTILPDALNTWIVSWQQLFLIGILEVSETQGGYSCCPETHN